MLYRYYKQKIEEYDETTLKATGRLSFRCIDIHDFRL